MTSLVRCIGISLIMHFILFSAIVSFHTSANTVHIPSVYEVSIVSAIGSASGERVRTKSLKSYRKKRISLKKRLPNPKKVGAIETSPLTLKAPDIKSSKSLKSVPKEKVSTETSGPYTSKATADINKGIVLGNEITLYKMRIRNIIRSNWRVPPEIALSQGTLKASYMIKVSRNGEVLDRKLVMSSGNQPYDASVFMALNSVKGFPVPPITLIAGADALEVVMTFSSEELEK